MDAACRQWPMADGAARPGANFYIVIILMVNTLFYGNKNAN
jgi:hypothetical protein